MATQRQLDGKVIPFPTRAPPGASELGDLRFRRLLGEAAWARLPSAVRARFARRVVGGKTVTYAGEVIECRMSRAGRLITQLARPIGGPLPLSTHCPAPACVHVTEDMSGGGQLWARLYGRRNGFPQAIHSAKRFAGPTGLEEYIGAGFGVALTVCVEDGALHFDSDHYFVAIGRWRLRLPDLVSPGALRVSHIDCNGGWFAFVLSLTHRWGGELIRQTALFQELGARSEEGRGGHA